MVASNISRRHYNLQCVGVMLSRPTAPTGRLVAVILLTTAYLHVMEVSGNINPTTEDTLRLPGKEPVPAHLIHTTREKRSSDEYSFKCGFYRCDSRKYWCDEVTQDCARCSVYCGTVRLQTIYHHRCENECSAYTELLRNRTEQFVHSKVLDKGIDNNRDKGIETNNDERKIKESQQEIGATTNAKTKLTGFQQSVLAVTVLAIVLTIVLIATICVFGSRLRGSNNVNLNANCQTQTIWSLEMEDGSRDGDFGAVILLHPKPQKEKDKLNPSEIEQPLHPFTQI